MPNHWGSRRVDLTGRSYARFAYERRIAPHQPPLFGSLDVHVYGCGIYLLGNLPTLSSLSLTISRLTHPFLKAALWLDRSAIRRGLGVKLESDIPKSNIARVSA